MGFLAGYAAFLDIRYWINPFPVPLGPSLVSQIFGFFAFFVVAAVALYVVAHTLRKKDELRANLLRRLGGPLLVTGVFGLFCLFFAYEQAPFLGMRFWFLLVMTYFLVRLGMIVSYAVRDYPGLRSAQAEKQNLAQYLPRKK